MIDFQKILKVLAAQHIEFIIVGGVAATVHGSAMLTQDIDVVYRRAPANLERLSQSLDPISHIHEARLLAFRSSGI